MDLVLADNVHRVEGVLLGKLGLDVLDDGAEVGGVLDPKSAVLVFLKSSQCRLSRLSGQCRGRARAKRTCSGLVHSSLGRSLCWMLSWVARRIR